MARLLRGRRSHAGIQGQASGNGHGQADSQRVQVVSAPACGRAKEGVLTRIGHRGSRRERPQNTTSRAGSAAKPFAMTAGKTAICSGSSVVTNNGVANRCEWLGRAPIPNDGGRRFESGPEHSATDEAAPLYTLRCPSLAQHMPRKPDRIVTWVGSVCRDEPACCRSE